MTYLVSCCLCSMFFFRRRHHHCRCCAMCASHSIILNYKPFAGSCMCCTLAPVFVCVCTRFCLELHFSTIYLHPILFRYEKSNRYKHTNETNSKIWIGKGKKIKKSLILFKNQIAFWHCWNSCFTLSIKFAAWLYDDMVPRQSGRIAPN